MQNAENYGRGVAIAALGNSIARWAENREQYTTAIPGLSLFRRDEPTEPITGMYEPSLEKPYLGLRLKLDLREISQMMVDSNLPQPRVRSATATRHYEAASDLHG